ncbi:MAG: hypothetical protein CVV56_05920 [Tenericutes bacterium HGW-Tenericutes-1]|jgi:hypothetical protein|nr:MAG: hypothetical protein CVV56_05920 [Tenericutes bacterium HGW-Tenericutes-1]
MICKVCDKIYSNHLSFRTMYQISILCPECTIKYKPSYSYEVIPIDLGIIEYFSVYDFEENNPRTKRFLYRYMRNYLIDLDKNMLIDSVFIFVDDTEYLNFSQWFPVMKKFRFLRIYSLFYFEWSLYEDLVLF